MRDNWFYEYSKLKNKFLYCFFSKIHSLCLLFKGIVSRERESIFSIFIKFCEMISVHLCVLIFCFKGTVSWDFLLQVFFHESSFSKPLKIRLGSFQTFSNFCSGIFASQGTPLVSTTQMGNLPPVSSTPVANLHQYQQHRWQLCREGRSQNSLNLWAFRKCSISGLSICRPNILLRFELQIFMQT